MSTPGTRFEVANVPGLMLWIGMLALFILGALMRLVGMSGNFWLDEIWSWDLARQVTSVGQIFHGIHHDNNNHLNTLWLYLCGQQSHLWIYRLHSYLAGLATMIGVAYLTFELSAQKAEQMAESDESLAMGHVDVDRRFQSTSTLAALLLVATSQYACVYATEARGYALAGAAAIFSTIVLRWYVGSGTSGSIRRVFMALIYAGITIAGILSHLTMFLVYAPQLIWSTSVLWRRRETLLIAMGHVPIILSAVALYIVDLQYSRNNGDGQPQYVIIAGFKSLALPFGAEAPAQLVLFAASIVCTLLFVGWNVLFQRSRLDAGLYRLLILLPPILIFVLRPGQSMYPRHFYVCWMPLFPLLGLALAKILFVPQFGLPTSLGLLAVWLGVNLSEFRQFATTGRGAYTKVIDLLVAEAHRSPKVPPYRFTLGGNHDFCTRLLLKFYKSRIPDDVLLTYFDKGTWPPEGVDWLIIERFDREFTAPSKTQVASVEYELVRWEPFSAPMGLGSHWAIFRRARK